ncbi:hypothetical protein BGI41_02015 [Methanobrevibacter sp. 87.7]|uniref:radical SAM protein n=1 Tax=Methanobrevibacter sp. 87.7 TaxID=387957 RepID=UPI000B4FFD5D|nr:4Fe-4S cluster-binding domain-containing protein [Methanobrevibacter sp. 87.7]OWT33515.1 hypothetical protein BGI41_02015 [Methanobrevibacter sp. 87.7]
MTIRITNIQHFSLQDGPGIRTTIFLKGCNLNCPWCCNPETINYNIEKYTEKGLKKEFGYDISIKELEKEILKDKIYYSKNNGGVTFSGGEPLLQIKELKPLLNNLKEKNINICFETALQIPSKLLKIAIKYIDEIFIDIKILTEKEAKTILNGNINLYYNNLEIISNSNIKNITFRIPINKEYTMKKDNINKISELISKYPNYNVEIFKIHNIGESKYKLLNRKLQNFTNITDKEINEICKKLKKYNKNIKIIKI